MYLGIFPTALGYLAWAFVLSRLPAQRAGSLLNVVPVLAVIIAWAWLDERPSVLTLMGGSVALVGVGLVKIAKTSSVTVPVREVSN